MKSIDVGRVSAIYPNRGTAKVIFDDKNVVSRELPVLMRGSQDSKDYWMPSIGEQVVCIFLQNTSKFGFIVGSFYNDEDKPPVQSEHIRHLKFKDGTYMEYDEESKTLTLDIKGEVVIKTKSAVRVEGDVIADGISLKNHTHSFNGSSGTTSVPR